MNVQSVSFMGFGPGVKSMLVKRSEEKGDNGYCNINPNDEGWGDARTKEDYLKDVKTVEDSSKIHIKYSDKYGLCVYKNSDDPNEGLRRIAELAPCDNSSHPGRGLKGDIRLRLQDVAKLAEANE